MLYVNPRRTNSRPLEGRPSFVTTTAQEYAALEKLGPLARQAFNLCGHAPMSAAGALAKLPLDEYGRPVDVKDPEVDLDLARAVYHGTDGVMTPERVRKVPRPKRWR